MEPRSTDYQFFFGERKHQANRDKLRKFVSDNRESWVCVFFNSKKKTYCVEVGNFGLAKFLNNREYLSDIARFLKRTEAIEDEQMDCKICFEDLPHKYPIEIFSMLTWPCSRCHITICVKCHIALQGGTQYTCPFCKMSTPNQGQYALKDWVDLLLKLDAICKAGSILPENKDGKE